MNIFMHNYLKNFPTKSLLRKLRNSGEDFLKTDVWTHNQIDPILYILKKRKVIN